MPIRLNGSTSGYTELTAPAVAGNNSIALPTGNGSSGQALQGNGAGALSWGVGVSSDSQLCKAWVNFNGTGTVAIRASFNVSSITDNGTGDYTVNFTTALADANFAALGSAGSGTVAAQTSIINDQGKTASTFRFLVGDTSGNGIDRSSASVAIFR
jgi:hypothetical protein